MQHAAVPVSHSACTTSYGGLRQQAACLPVRMPTLQVGSGCHQFVFIAGLATSLFIAWYHICTVYCFDELLLHMLLEFWKFQTHTMASWMLHNFIGFGIRHGEFLAFFRGLKHNCVVS